MRPFYEPERELLASPSSRRRLRMVFGFYVQPYSGFSLFGGQLRQQLDQVLDLLEDPCSGERLRHPVRASPSQHRWDEFCKVKLRDDLRLIYRWEPQEPLITIEFVGPRLHGDPRSVYELLRHQFGLPDDAGHRTLPIVNCCDDTGSAVREFTHDEARAVLTRLSKR